MTKDELIGCYYPVKNNENRVIGFRTIKAAYDLANQAGYGILLTNDATEALLIISYTDASNLTKRSPILD